MIIGEHRILVAKTLMTREAIKNVIWMKLDKIIMESDSEVVACSIMDKVIAPK